MKAGTAVGAGGNSVLLASCGELDRTRPLLEGRVPIEGFELRFLPDPFPIAGLLEDYQDIRNLRMTEDKAFAVCEVGLAPLMAALSRGLDLVAIPVFHYRRFRHTAIVCHAAAGIRRPADLVGKRVGVRRFALTAGIWGRGLLQHECGVPLERIRWVVQTDTPLRLEVRDRLDITQVGSDELLERLLLRREIDATIEPVNINPLREASPLVHPLFEDAAAMEIDYYRRTAIFPIMHTIVMWRPLIERHPELPQQIHAAFVQSKALGNGEADRPARYILAEEERKWLRQLAHRDRITFLGDSANPRDPWKYSLREDRKTVETFLNYAFEQGITTRRFAVEEVFAPTTLDL